MSNLNTEEQRVQFCRSWYNCDELLPGWHDEGAQGSVILSGEYEFEPSISLPSTNGKLLCWSKAAVRKTDDTVDYYSKFAIYHDDNHNYPRNGAGSSFPSSKTTTPPPTIASGAGKATVKNRYGRCLLCSNVLSCNNLQHLKAHIKSCHSFCVPYADLPIKERQAHSDQYVKVENSKRVFVPDNSKKNKFFDDLNAESTRNDGNSSRGIDTLFRKPNLKPS